MRGVGRGGKTLFGQQRFEGLEERFLVLFDRQHIVAALLVEDLLYRLHLGVCGIGQHGFPYDLHFGQLFARGGNLVAFVGDQRRPQPSSQIGRAHV